MSVDKNKLNVFGYGISLIIPFFMCLQMLKPTLSFGAFVLTLLGGFALLLIIISKIASYKRMYNLWIPLVQLNVAILKAVSGAGVGAMVALGIAVAFCIITMVKVELLSAPYKLWMKAAGAINFVASTVMMSVVFYFVFAPVGLVLRVLRKDLLDQKIDPEKESYWIKRESVTDKERYKNQF